jgi:hypothetical protein
MRNTILQTLPPHAELAIDIDPPMSQHERPYLLALKGRPSAALRVLDEGHVLITNSTDEPSVFIFSVGPVMHVPPAVQAAFTAFLSARKNPS